MLDNDDIANALALGTGRSARLLHDVVGAIDNGGFDEPVQEAFGRCLPHLLTALADVPPIDATGLLLLAAATDLGSIVIASEGWPQVGKQAQVRAALAVEVKDAIESPTYQGGTVVAGTAMLLGAEKLDVLNTDLARIGRGGDAGLVVVLVARTGSTVSFLVTSTVLPTGMVPERRTFH